MFQRFLSVLFVSSALALASCAPADIHDRTPDNRVTTTPPRTQGQITPIPATPLPGAPGQSAAPTADARVPDSVPTVKVALLLPLSGESAGLGQEMLDAATLALYDQYISLPPERITAKVVLVPKDTTSSPGTAVSAATQAIEQGASLLIGPLFSQSVSAVAPVARKANIPVLSLSNNKAVAAPNIYVYGFLPDQQVKRVAEFAALQKIESVGALVPNDAYGATVAETLKNSLTPQGIRVEPVEMYAKSLPNIEAAILRLKEGYTKTPFKALFLPEGSAQLKTILAKLKGQGIDRGNVRLIGTGVWDDEEIRTNPDMRGGWFASAPPQFNAAFERRFFSAYGYKPKRLASLAYDAVALAATVALQSGGADYSLATLTNPDGFTGPANGLYRLLPDGTTERSLAVMEITSGDVTVLEAAPKMFKH